MPDYTQLSDEELYKIAGVNPSNKSTTDYSSMSDEELAKRAGVSLKSPTIGDKIKKGLGLYMKEAQPAFKWAVSGMPKDIEGINQAEKSNWADIYRQSGAKNVGETGLLPFAKSKSTASQLIPQIIGEGLDLATRPSSYVAPRIIKKGFQILPTVGEAISKKMPKIMGEKWFENEAKLAQRTAGGLEKTRGLAYKNVYNKVNDYTVDNNAVKSIMEKYDLIDELGTPDNVITIKDAKMLSDELSKYTPTTIKKGAVYGKGGIANPKIRATGASREIKDLIYNTVDTAEKQGTIEQGVSKQLKDLDALSREKLYPRSEKIRAIGGYSPEPETSGVAGAYRILGGSESSAGKRLAIKRAPEAIKEVSKYISPEEQETAQEALKNALQLKKNMGKYRGRQITKVLATGGGGFMLVDYLIRRKFGKAILGGQNR